MTISQYKQICQKNSNENYLIDKYIYRKVSIFGTIVFLKLGISPNLVTLISLFASLCSLWFLAQNTQLALMIGAFLVFLYHYLDHVDGELARYYIYTKKMVPNLRGQYFDVLCHSFSDNLMFMCMSWAIYQQFGYTYVLWFGVIAMVGSSGFPKSVAAKILIGRLINNPALINDDQFKAQLWKIERKKNQIEAMNAPLYSKSKFFKIISEILGYPGVLSAIMLVVLLDAYFGVHSLYGFEFDFRLLFLVFSAAFRLLIIPFSSYKWMKIFEKLH